MIDFYYWPTPNGWKASIMLEECDLPYRMIPVNIAKGDQFTPEFLAISPNNRMPAIVDHDDSDGPLSVFESGAILMHLAERTGRFMPTGRVAQKEMREWLFWQVGNLGPMAGQHSHFFNYAPDGQQPIHNYVMPMNTIVASASWSAGWKDEISSSTTIPLSTWPAGRGF